ncbi:MAG TPA: hypothetical protein V6C89_15170 [Drouetiella sp.]
MKITTYAAVVLSALTLSAAPSFGSPPVANASDSGAPVTIKIRAQSQTASSSTGAGKYNLVVTMLDYQNQVAGKKSGKTLSIKTETPPKPCSATDFAGTPEKQFRKFDATGCQLLDGGKSLAFRTDDGFALAMVEGTGRSRHVVVHDSDGKVMWERFGSAAYFVRTGGFRCKATVTNSVDASFQKEFTGRCFSFIGRDVDLGVVMITDSGGEVLVDVTNK